MGEAQPHFQTIFLTILMGSPFNRIQFFKILRVVHTQCFCSIVVGKFVLIMHPSLVKIHPHWKMGMASPLNLKKSFFYKWSPYLINVHFFFPIWTWLPFKPCITNLLLCRQHLIKAHNYSNISGFLQEVFNKHYW